jgi:hypothetical protein
LPLDSAGNSHLSFDNAGLRISDGSHVGGRASITIGEWIVSHVVRHVL